MEIYHHSNENILSLMNVIDKNIQTLDNYEDNIHKKQISILNLISKLQKKAFFDLNDSLSNLKFQSQILKNEEKYSKELKRIFLEKIYNDIYQLAESILMFISSIDNIEFDDNNGKKSIQKRLSTIKHISHDSLNIKGLFNLINSINNNLDLIKSVIDNFNKFITNVGKTIKDNNFHCKTFSTNLNNQKSHIVVEYNKYCDQLVKILEYYNSLSKNISIQLDNQKIVEFCVDSIKKEKQINKSFDDYIKENNEYGKDNINQLTKEPDMIDNNSEDINDNESNISLNISEINSDIEN
jgi:hypothetical protein